VEVVVFCPVVVDLVSFVVLSSKLDAASGRNCSAVFVLSGSECAFDSSFGLLF
jgi:hypothetical protein